MERRKRKDKGELEISSSLPIKSRSSVGSLRNGTEALCICAWAIFESRDILGKNS